MTASRMKLIEALGSLENNLRYFVFLIEKEEIRESSLLEYYLEQLHDDNVNANVKFISKQHPDMEKYTQEILTLVKRYHELTGKMQEYKE